MVDNTGRRGNKMNKKIVPHNKAQYLRLWLYEKFTWVWSSLDYGRGADSKNQYEKRQGNIEKTCKTPRSLMFSVQTNRNPESFHIPQIRNPKGHMTSSPIGSLKKKDFCKNQFLI